MGVTRTVRRAGGEAIQPPGGTRLPREDPFSRSSKSGCRLCRGGCSGHIVELFQSEARVGKELGPQAVELAVAEARFFPAQPLNLCLRRFLESPERFSASRGTDLLK